MAKIALGGLGRPPSENSGSRLIVLLTFLLGLSVVFPFAAHSGEAGFFDDFQVIQTGKTRIFRVPPGGTLQRAIDQASPGDTIELEPGAVYQGAFTLPEKAGAEFITIRTAAKDNQLPANDTRIDPARHIGLLPKIVSNVKGLPAIRTASGAHHFRFTGIEFGPTPGGLYDIIRIGTANESSLEELPHHIEFDRIYIHGGAVEGQRRGIAANGRYISIKNSYFSDFKREGEESQAIAVWSGDGPIEIINNYLEAAAESILFGGAQSRLGTIPGNAVIRGNWLNKPVEWRSAKWVVKNFLEIKSGRRITIENNLMTNNWTMAQEGTGILFRTGDDSGRDAVVEDIEFNGNIVRGSGSAVTVFGGEGKGGRRLAIRNNVFDDINGSKWSGRGFFIKCSAWDDLVVENNTVINDGSITIAYGEPITRFVFRNNIVFHNEYGFFGDGIGSGAAAVTRYFPGSVITNNALIGGSREFGNVNLYPPNLQQLGFLNPSAGDYRLSPNSRFVDKGVGGGRIGADVDPGNVGGKY